MLTNLLMRLCFNLPNTFASDAEDFAYFFQRMVNAVFESMTQFEDFPLFGRKVFENHAHLVGKNTSRYLGVWR